MKAKTAQIYVDGKLILHATNLCYDNKELKLSGLLLKGSVERVTLVSEGLQAGKALDVDAAKTLEIRLSMF